MTTHDVLGPLGEGAHRRVGGGFVTGDDQEADRLRALIVLVGGFLMKALPFLVVILLPFFNEISEKTLTISTLTSLKSLTIIFVMPILIGLLAGSYPAIFLSSFEPIKVLKGRLSLKGGSLRNVLVIFQFATSIVLIIGTVIIYRQINFTGSSIHILFLKTNLFLHSFF